MSATRRDDLACTATTTGNDVALAGIWIAERTPGADIDFILTFAALHDVMRKSDGGDPMHGPRAAQLIAGLLDAPGLVGFTP